MLIVYKERLKMDRSKNIDVLRGILIIFVVAAHYRDDLFHDIIFLFHMPLFFIVSGLLIQEQKIKKRDYIQKKIINLLIPYAIYLLIDVIIVRHNFTKEQFFEMIWGGRAISGTYWYITCYVFALLLLTMLVKKFKKNWSIVIIIIGGIISVIESNVIDEFSILRYPGVPGNIDVALLALVYIGIGFYFKELINKWIYEKNIVFDFIAFIITVLLIIFCFYSFLYKGKSYYFDMKQVYYKDLLLAIIIPCMFGIVLLRIIKFLISIRKITYIMNFFMICGRCTIPIMFIHLLANHWKDSFNYGRLLYMILGIGVPLIFVILCQHNKKIQQIFGIPKIQR